jgi:hypothetical protein
VNGSAIDESAPDDEVAPRRSREQTVIGRRLLREHVVDRDQVEQLAVEPCHRAELRFAQPGGERDYRLEYGLGVGG